MLIHVLAESTGATVEWDNFKKIATVTTNQKKKSL